MIDEWRETAISGIVLRHALLVILSSILLLWETTAHAGTVAIVQRPNPTAGLIEALSRIHGELLSVGLEVRMIERPPARGLDEVGSQAWLESLAAEGQIDAVIEIVGDLTPTAVDIWVIEQGPRRLTVSRIALEPNTRNASETLAIRAVEVLRSTFLQKDMEARERHSLSVAPAPAPKSVSEPVTPSFPRSRLQAHAPGHVEVFGVAAGAAVLTSLDGVGPVVMPLARVDWSVRSWFELQATLAGLGTHSTVSNTHGSAQIAQKYGIFGGCFGLHAKGRLRPFFALAAGVLHTSTEGQADSPRQGHDVGRWSMLLNVGFGTELRLTERYYLSFAAHAQMAAPYVAIHIMDAVVATSGRPNLALTLTVGAWL
jgi:hypothetical protein